MRRKIASRFFVIEAVWYTLTSRIICNDKANYSYDFNLPLDWYLDEILFLAMTTKDGWGGLAESPRAMEVVVSR